MSLTAFKVFITVSYTGTDAPAAHKTIRRFSAKPGTTLAEFRKILVEEILRRPEGSVVLTVSYKDVDGDVVEVASELEWAEALQQHSGAVTAGTAIPIQVNVKADVPSENKNVLNVSPVDVPTGTVALPSPTQPADAMSQFSPIDPSDDEYSDFFATESSHDNSRPVVPTTEGERSEEPQIAQHQSPVVQKDEINDNLQVRAPTPSAKELRSGTEENALEAAQPSTDALMLENESIPPSHEPTHRAPMAHNGWEEIDADEGSEQSFVGEEIEMTSVTHPEEVDVPTGNDESATEDVPVESQNSQPTQPQQQQQARQPRPNNLGFFAPALAWLSLAHQQFAAQPRANNRYPRWQAPSGNASAMSASALANHNDATVTRYHKRTGATKAEDVVRLLALCPNATAQQAQEVLEKYNGQVYRAANHLLDITSTAAQAE